MSSIGKSFALVLIVVMAMSSLSVMMVKFASAQSFNTPSVPEFSVRYVDNSYYASNPITITDQYGNSRVVQGYVENKTVEFSIKNQAFTSYTIPYNSSDSSNTGQTVNLMFNIRTKVHSGDNWMYVTHLSDGYLKQSDTNFTTASYQLDYLFPISIPYGMEVDFQVQALIGYVHRYPIINSDTFNGTESDWSSIQTLTIPSTSTSISPSPTSTVTELPTTPHLSSDRNAPYLDPIFFLLTAIVAIALIAIVILRKKTKKHGNLSPRTLVKNLRLSLVKECRQKSI